MNEFYFFSHCYRSQSGMRLNLCFYDPIYSMAPGTWGPPAARLQQRYSVTNLCGTGRNHRATHTLPALSPLSRAAVVRGTRRCGRPKRFLSLETTGPRSGVAGLVSPAASALGSPMVSSSLRRHGQSPPHALGLILFSPERPPTALLGRPPYSPSSLHHPRKGPSPDTHIGPAPPWGWGRGRCPAGTPPLLSTVSGAHRTRGHVSVPASPPRRSLEPSHSRVGAAGRPGPSFSQLRPRGGTLCGEGGVRRRGGCLLRLAGAEHAGTRSCCGSPRHGQACYREVSGRKSSTTKNDPAGPRQRRASEALSLPRFGAAGNSIFSNGAHGAGNKPGIILYDLG